MYKRVLLKLSGEALGLNGHGFDFENIKKVASQIGQMQKEGVQIGIVIGAGNIWRGRQGTDMDRVTADHMGMLATVINTLAVKDALCGLGIPCCAFSCLQMDTVAEPYASRKAIEHLEKGEVCIFGGGTGSPFFSTDTGAVLRAAEINADVILLAKNIDGVYTSDPNKDANAKRYKTLSFTKMLADKLKAIDSTAAAICEDNDIPVLVFALNEENSIKRACEGEEFGTVMKKDIASELY